MDLKLLIFVLALCIPLLYNVRISSKDRSEFSSLFPHLPEGRFELSHEISDWNMIWWLISRRALERSHWFHSDPTGDSLIPIPSEWNNYNLSEKTRFRMSECAVMSTFIFQENLHVGFSRQIRSRCRQLEGVIRRTFVFHVSLRVEALAVRVRTCYRMLEWAVRSTFIF